MQIIQSADEAVNRRTLPPGSVVAMQGSAATPRELCRQMARDLSIRGIALISCLPMGDIAELFSEEACSRITHRVTFNTALSRAAQNNGWAQYQLMHLSDIPRQMRDYLKPTAALVSVAGPDNAGNFSLGPMVVETKAAIASVKAQGGVVIAERNRKTPFIFGTTVRREDIDYLLETDYELPVSAAKTPGDRARRIGEIITALYIRDGCTIQYGIGEVPAAVTDGILRKGVRDLGVHTELYTDAFRVLMERGIVTNRHTVDGITIASIFQCGDQAGYDWLHFNCSVASRPSDYTNNALTIARQPKMVAVNSSMGVDLYGNIWADSVQAPLVYSGVGGQADFLRGGAPVRRRGADHRHQVHHRNRRVEGPEELAPGHHHDGRGGRPGRHRDRARGHGPLGALLRGARGRHRPVGRARAPRGSAALRLRDPGLQPAARGPARGVPQRLHPL